MGLSYGQEHNYASFSYFYVHIEERRARGLQQWLDTLPPCSQPDSLGFSEVCLAVGAMIVEEMRAAVEQQTGFRCSAGISHNKVIFLFVFSKEVFIQNILFHILIIIIIIGPNFT